MSERHQNPPVEEKNAQEPPKYIVSYAAMMTILLAFFILLNNMATVREYGMKGAGLGAFKMSFVASGLPGFLTSSTDAMSFDAPGGKYRPEIEDDDEVEPAGKSARNIHSDDKNLDESRQELIATNKEVVWPLDVPYGHALTPAAKAHLRKLARMVRPTDRVILVRATLVDGEDGRYPWSGAINWALLIANYLKEEGKMPPHRVIAAGEVCSRDELKEGESDIDYQSRVGVLILPPAHQPKTTGADD
jgi:Membrane MotB of proton-channel complex MotA/MotB